MEAVTRKAGIRISQSFVREMKEKGHPVDKAILFGSVAKGLNSEQSDIDLAIWGSNFTGCLSEDIVLFASIRIKYPRLEVHTFHSSETADTNPFIGEILNHGIPIEVPS